MLHPDGLDEDGMDAYHRALAGTHWRTIEAEVSTLDGDLVAHLTPEVSDGQIIVDTEAEDDVPGRIAEMVFAQRTRMLFEPESASDMPFHRKYALTVWDCRWVAELERWVECPVISGPLWDFDRAGAEVRVVAHNWDRQLMQPKWNPETYRKGTKVTDVMKDLLAECGFIQLGGIPDLPATLPERLTVTKRDMIRPVIVKLARSVDRQFYFHPGGPRPMLRRIPDAPAFTFDWRHLVAEPILDREAKANPNVFEALGAKPKGAKRRIRDVRELDPDHPNSKESLALNGRPFRTLVTEENRAIKTQEAARSRTKRMRSDAERGMTDVQVDVVPFPHFEGMDLAKVDDEVGTERIRLKRFTLGLGRDASPLSINSLRPSNDRDRRPASGKDHGRGAA